MRDIDLVALRFVKDRGVDAVGVIDSEEKLAAALLYIDLEKRGLLKATRTPSGPEYRITPAGEAAIGFVH